MPRGGREVEYVFNQSQFGVLHIVQDLTSHLNTKVLTVRLQSCELLCFLVIVEPDESLACVWMRDAYSCP